MKIQPGTISAAATASAVSPPAVSAAAGRSQAPPPQHAPSSAEALKQVANQINDFLKASDSDLQFTVDRESGQVVVRIVDAQTQDLIRQIPSDEMLAIAHALDRMSGLLIDQKT